MQKHSIQERKDRNNSLWQGQAVIIKINGDSIMDF